MIFENNINLYDFFKIDSFQEKYTVQEIEKETLLKNFKTKHHIHWSYRRLLNHKNTHHDINGKGDMNGSLLKALFI